MNPIGHSTNNMLLGAPKGHETNCVPLAATMLIDEINGATVIASFWKPTVEELEILNSNGCVKLYVHGNQHPMVWIEAESSK